MSDVIGTGFTGAYRADHVHVSAGQWLPWYLPGLMRFNAPDDFSPFGAGGINRTSTAAPIRSIAAIRPGICCRRRSWLRQTPP
jgi:hypothetical protein